MAKRFPVVLATALLTVLWWQPVAAQPAKARATASVDLNARLQQAQADPQLAQTLLATGRKVAAVCAHCHGEGGNSVSKPIFPIWPGKTQPIYWSSYASLPRGGGATSSWKA